MMITTTGFFGEYSNLKYYRILHAKHAVGWTKYQGNSRNLQEVWRKVWEEREQVRHSASEVGNGCWNPTAAQMPGSVKHLWHNVHCHWMTGKEVGLGCVSVALLPSRVSCELLCPSLLLLLLLRLLVDLSYMSLKSVANLVSFDFNVSYSSCWGYFKKIKISQKISWRPILRWHGLDVNFSKNQLIHVQPFGDTGWTWIPQWGSARLLLALP